jgi:hypothetical protein
MRIVVGMNIRCFWDLDGNLIIKSGTPGIVIGYVSGERDDPVLTITYRESPSLSFSEIEHIMDNWHNMPKTDRSLMWR